MEWADANGGLSGPNIKRAMYQNEDWVPAGLEGVCSPATWTVDDHRGSVISHLRLRIRYTPRMVEATIR